MTQLDRQDEPLRRELYELADLLMRDGMSAASLERLEQLLATEPEAMRLYVQHMHDTHSLHTWAGLLAPQTPLASRPPISPPALPILAPGSKGASWLSRRMTMVLLALMVIGTLAAWKISRPANPPDRVKQPRASDAPTVATLLRARGAVWATSNSLPSSTPLYAGQTLQLEKGLAEIRFNSGARLILEGPAVFVAETGNSGRLEAGKLAAQVPPPAHGFTITTVDARIVDEGTAFGVFVQTAALGLPNPKSENPKLRSKSSSTEVHVFEGIVHAGPVTVDGAESPQTRAVAGGQAVRIGPQGAPEPIASDAVRFVRSLEPLLGPGAIVISELDDGGTLRKVPSGEILATHIQNNCRPVGLAFSPDGATLYFAFNHFSGGSGEQRFVLLSVNTLHPARPQSTIVQNSGMSSLGIVAERSGTLLLGMRAQGSNKGKLIRIDPARKNHWEDLAVDLPIAPLDIAVAPSGSIYVALSDHGVAQVDPVSGALATIIRGMDAVSLTVDPNGGDLLVAVKLPSLEVEIRRYRPDGTGGKLVSRLDDRFRQLAIDADGTILAVRSGYPGGGVWRVDPQSGLQQQVYESTAIYQRGLAVFPSAK